MIRNKRSLKFVSQSLLWIFLFQICAPSTALALTGGPSQPEVESFQPIGLNNLVDPFSGNFSYNIPIMDVGGYPINLAYNSGISMDQEASWVGLGWNLNPGMINRTKRGLPDEFNGDQIITKMNMRRNETYSFSGDFAPETLGFELFSGSAGVALNYNTYTGVGVDLSLGANYQFPGSEHFGTANMGVNFLSSSNNGVDVQPSVSYSNTLFGEKLKLNTNYSLSSNSRSGFKGTTLGSSIKPGPGLYPTAKQELTNEQRKKANGEISKKLSSYSIGYLSTSYVPSTYTPQLSLPYVSGNYSASFKTGLELFGVTGTFNMKGTYSYQDLKTNVMSSAAYGYMNLENSLSDETATMDFNREKDGSFSKYTTNLPITNLTHDLYTIAGQGINGMFRSYRSDLGYVKDPTMLNSSTSGNVSVEVSGANMVKVGADIKVNSTPSFSGHWEQNNDADQMAYQATSSNSITKKSYFAMIGDMSPDIVEGPSSKSNWWKTKVHGKEPIRVDITGTGYDQRASNNFAYNDFSTHSFGSTLRDHRVRKSQQISDFSIGELEDLVDAMGYYAGESSVDNLGPSIAKSHHIGQFTVTKPDGNRYVYGLPVYNTKSKDVSFNVSGRMVHCEKGLVDYSAQDASADNDRGQDQFFQSVETPAYAHAYMLTEVLSSDYSDYDDIPGPSEGDLGTYYKFEYSTVSNYKWRIPFARFQANHDPGLQSKNYDDKGHYSYGEKELKYLQKIESRTHVAIFHTSDREDSKGVQDEHGGYDAATSASMRKLDSVSLYTKVDYDQNGLAARPIKTAHFEYDYTLCKNISNHESYDPSTPGLNLGKLTLTKVYFTYGFSHRSRANAYVFTYADLNHDGVEDANPDYDIKAYDRWGSYSPNDQGCSMSSEPKRSEDPYTIQDKSVTDIYKASWCLTDIQIPSGGLIEVDYESDDYAYVQDRRAMEMIEVLGTGISPSGFNAQNPNHALYDGKTPNNYLFIAVDQIDGDDNLDSLKLKYFHNIGKDPILYKFKVQLTTNTGPHDYEWITGYSIVEEVGFVPSSNNEYAYIKVKKIKTGDNVNTLANAHPISVKSWNHLRMYNSDLAYSSKNVSASTDPSQVKIESVFVELLDSFKAFFEFIAGPNGTLRQKRFARKFEPGHAWLRLTNPSFKKLGGDVRVSKVSISDSWDQIGGGERAEYGQEYSYTLKNGKSSGVASYEPTIGGEENPFKMPMLPRKANSNQFEKEDYLYVPGQYQEGPFGESFFPAPGIGYSRVEVKSIVPSNASLHGNGRVVQEFYTSKDFPTIVEQTDLEERLKPPSRISSWLKFDSKEHLNTGQGYVICKNDMHGKSKAKWVYPQGAKEPISGVEYVYKTKDDRLHNVVPMLHGDNSVSENLELGVEYDLVNDFRFMSSEAASRGAQINTDGFVLGILPIVIPIAIPAYSKSYRAYRSVATTKVVNSFGVLEKTIVYNEDAISETKNLLWDAETGQVVLSKVNDRFDEEVYSFEYPAHLAYPAMGGAYHNETFVYQTQLIFQEPFVKESDPAFKYFQEGDQVLVKADGHSPVKAWLIQTDYTKNEVTEKGFFLIDKVGNPIPGGNYSSQAFSHSFSEYSGLNNKTVELQIIHSGYNNKVGSLGALTLKSSPIISDGAGGKKLSFGESSSVATDVLSAQAQSFSDEWQARDYKPLLEGWPGYSSWDIDDDPVLQADAESFLEDMLQCLATNGWLNGPVNLDETDLIYASSNPVSATDFSEFCKNLYGCNEPDGFAKDGIQTVNNVGQPLVQIEVDWTLVPEDNSYSATEVGVCNITLTMGSCTGLAMSLVTNFCEDEFTGGSLDVGITGVNSMDFSFDNPLTGNNIYTNRQGQNYGAFGQVKFNGNFSRVGSHVPNTCLNLLYLREGTPAPPYNILNNNPNSFRCGNGYLGYQNYGVYCQIKTHEIIITEDPSAIVNYYNPFVSGSRGQWRAKANYLPWQNRATGNGLGAGRYGISPFWTYNSVQEQWIADEQNPEWLYGGESTQFDPIGRQVEASDAGGTFSAALFDDDHFAKATGQNIAYGEFIGLDFEENAWDFYSGPEDEELKYFVFEDGIQSQLTSQEKHSGKQSYAQTGTDGVLATIFDPGYYPRNVNSVNQVVPFLYFMEQEERLNTFLQIKEDDILEENQLFVVSYWVKSSDLDLEPGDVEINFNSYDDLDNLLNSSQSFITAPSDPQIYPAINGWQKVVQVLEVIPWNDDIPEIKVEISNSTGSTVYIDDFRFYPLDGAMTTNVYDKTTGRLSAQLDANNYASYYEYDEEGVLVRIKKETDRGLETIQETRQNLVK